MSYFVNHDMHHGCSSNVRSVGLRWLVSSRKQKRHDSLSSFRLYIEALRPAVRCSLCSEAPKSGCYKSGKGSLGAILQLVGGEVSSLMSMGISPSSLLLGC